MRYIFRAGMHPELLNAATMLPGIAMAVSWPVDGPCSIVPYAYSAVCLASAAYHITNYVVGHRHDGLFILDVFAQMVCCASITYSGRPGPLGPLGPLGAAFILGMALGSLGCYRRHAIFLSGVSIMLTSGPRASSLWWALAFAFYFCNKVLDSRFRYFHVLFHIVGHVAVHCTVANMSCYG